MMSDKFNSNLKRLALDLHAARIAVTGIAAIINRGLRRRGLFSAGIIVCCGVYQLARPALSYCLPNSLHSSTKLGLIADIPGNADKLPTSQGDEQQIREQQIREQRLDERTALNDSTVLNTTAGPLIKAGLSASRVNSAQLRSGPRLVSLPKPERIRNGRYVTGLPSGELANLTLDVRLQQYVAELVRRAQAPHIAIVAMNPSNGRILAYASKSKIKDLITHAGFPAASLFKVVTSAAALERSSLEPDSLIPFRGGTYELDRWNYAPDPRRDRRLMTLTEALGKSCNPVFGRVALSYLSSPILQFYANAFGFNKTLGFDAPLEISSAAISNDSFERSRAGAGFGEVFISPVHAAALMSGIANRGVMPRPSLIESFSAADGKKMIAVDPRMEQRMITPATAARLMRMMVSSTTKGTSRRDFMGKKAPILGSLLVAAKTGTLSGKNPVGLNHWFIAAAPVSSPRIAIAIISVNPRNSSARPGRLGRQIIQNFL